MTHGEATHVYCDLCRKIQPVIFERLAGTSTDGAFVGGDIVCWACKYVIATIFKQKDS